MENTSCGLPLRLIRPVFPIQDAQPLCQQPPGSKCNLVGGNHIVWAASLFVAAGASDSECAAVLSEATWQE